ncbi:leucine-rich repeat-containing protein 72-like [Gigantopelta aegis]|uniref:leucine-rich repeat-containing protein 72-like n=1 Tax=Gigantopelta aegis TaxID=1735272 RepID=UPI001B889E00|nr:leucine-rich repeat-containing protein 72-like [Gigantopelta aegis]
MEESKKALAEFLSQQGLKDKDVEEIYLSNKGLTKMCDLQRFRFLKYLWLNGNKLRRINCLQGNAQLTELYLQDNALVDITGALHQLTCLKTLLLHNNQLTDLEDIVNELHKMQSLETLNLLNNPVAQETEYRFFVICSLPSLKLLDRKEIQKSERDFARKIYDQNQEEVRQTIAFGRRSQGPPDLFFPSAAGVKKMQPRTDDLHIESKEVANNFLKDCTIYEDVEEAFNVRRLKNSVKLYTSFDWSKVPRIEERRQAETPFDSPEIITHVYR